MLLLTADKMNVVSLTITDQNTSDIKEFRKLLLSRSSQNL